MIETKFQRMAGSAFRLVNAVGRAGCMFPMRLTRVVHAHAPGKWVFAIQSQSTFLFLSRRVLHGVSRKLDCAVLRPNMHISQLMSVLCV